MSNNFCFSSSGMFEPRSRNRRGWRTVNLILDITILAKRRARMCSGITGSQYLRYLDSNIISSWSIILSFSARGTDWAVSFCQLPPKGTVGSVYRRNFPMSYIIKRKVISVKPTCPLGSTIISDVSSPSLMLRGRTEPQYSLLTGVSTLDRWAQRESKTKMCRQSLLRVWASMTDRFAG